MVSQRPDMAPSHAACFDSGSRTPANEASNQAAAPARAHCDPALKAERLAEYERLSGPARYHGGPVCWETGKPLGVVR